MKIHIVSGIGSGPTELAAFDGALIDAGVANYNLIRLSSVIPPKAQIVEYKDDKLESPLKKSQWGDRLYLVYAEKRITRPNSEAWAGIGWVTDKKTGKGLFVEHEGGNKKVVEENIRDSLYALMAARNVDFGSIQMKVAGRRCKRDPICAFVAAIYKAESW